MSRFPKLDPVFVVQSGLTTAFATGVATARLSAARMFALHWIASFFAAWALVLLLAPCLTALIRRLVAFLTRDE